MNAISLSSGTRRDVRIENRPQATLFPVSAKDLLDHSHDHLKIVGVAPDGRTTTLGEA